MDSYVLKKCSPDLCPKCGLPVPANEWASYRRHEDCTPDRQPPRVVVAEIKVKPRGRVVHKTIGAGA